jgi:hypothetical protein
MHAGSDGFVGRLGLVAVRAARVGCIAGAVVGGVIGTIDAPIVGTFFGALYGWVLGTVSGVTDGVVLTGITRVTRSRWVTRLVSALMWLVAFRVAVAVNGPFTVLHDTVGKFIVAVVCVLLGAGVGPFIAFGGDRAVLVGRFAAVPLSRLASWVLMWGAAGGAAVGAVTGLVIGIWTYLPTAPFAAVEGAVLGSVSGTVLAALLGGVAALPRLWARR